MDELKLTNFKNNLQQELTRLGINTIRESTDIVVRKKRVVGYVIGCSWEQLDTDIRPLLEIIEQWGGYGTIRTEGVVTTLQVSISLN